ncbi:MAG: hypothetical protein ABEH77_08000 [Halobacteriaceae archaeon]
MAANASPGPREYRGAGALAALLALAVVPALDALVGLRFLGGLAVAVGAPVPFAAVAAAAGGLLVRRGRREGWVVALAGVGAAVAGALYGVSAVL